MSSKMKYLQYCLQHKIPIIPLKLWIHADWVRGRQENGVTGETLSDGSQKMKKQICSDKFKDVAAVKKFYGDELGEILLNKTTTKKLPSGVVKLCPDYNDFNLPKRLLNKFMKKRWESYNNGNLMKYTHFAVDTRCIGILDIDCELPDNSPINKLKERLPYKKSNSKKFGGHLIFNRKDIPFPHLRTSQDLPKKFGICKNGTAGLEFLDGIWEWSPLDDDIYFPQDCEEGSPPPDLEVVPILKKILLKLNEINTNLVNHNNMEGETKADREPTTAPPPVPLPSASALSPFPLVILMENLEKYSVDKMSNVKKAAGVIISFASSGDEQVFQVLLNSCKRLGANYGGEAWVRDIWGTYRAEIHPDYKNRFDTYWCINQKKKFDWKIFMEDEEMCVQHKFIENHQRNFIINTDYKREITQLCYYDEVECLWRHDPKAGIGKGVIHHLLLKEERDYWRVEMEASIEAMDDHNIDDEGGQTPNTFKVTAKLFMKQHLKKYHSTGNWLGGTIRQIYNQLLYNTKLRQEVQFNLMPHTSHLFQFQNGAYNLKTGELEPRTREMSITNSGILKYDYEEGDFSKETQIIKTMIEQIIPNPADREAWCAWKGYCLTGDINGQMFLLYLGASAGNGKSTLCEAFKDAFPCYCKKIKNDAVIDKAKDDKTLSSLVNTSYRCVYVEEIAEIGLKIKELTQAIVPVKPLYMEEMDLVVAFKFEGLCNEVPICKTEEGVLRRARQLECNSQFVDDEDDIDTIRHIYLKDPNLGLKFKTDTNMKLALFHYFAKYARKYYDNGVNEFKKQFENMRQAFQETNQEDDTMAQFITLHFVIDNNDEATISKQQMLQHLFQETGGEFTKTDGNQMIYKQFSVVRKEFQQRRYKYDSQMRISGEKGFFTNIRFVANNPESDDE